MIHAVKLGIAFALIVLIWVLNSMTVAWISARLIECDRQVWLQIAMSFDYAVLAFLTGFLVARSLAIVRTIWNS